MKLVYRVSSPLAIWCGVGTSRSAIAAFTRILKDRALRDDSSSSSAALAVSLDKNEGRPTPAAAAAAVEAPNRPKNERLLRGLSVAGFSFVSFCLIRSPSAKRGVVDLVVFSNYAGRGSRYGGCQCGDEIRGSIRSDPIFRPLDKDAQQSKSFVFWALGVVGTLLNAPKLFCFFGIPKQAS